MPGIADSLKDFLKEVGGEVIGDKEVKTNAIILATKALIGSEPIIDRSNPAVNVIKFTKAQRLKLENFMNKKSTTDTGKPSNVKIEHTSLWMPYALKKTVPYLIGVATLGFIAGRYIK